MIPCQLCPRHTFTGPPIYGGYRECDKCADGSYTAKLGSTGPSQCKLPCDAGQFSVSGLQPCSPCPINFYQPSVGQQRCIECANDTVTSRAGANTQQLCLPVECATVKCDNRAECVVINHKAECLCRPGFTVRIHLLFVIVICLFQGDLCDQSIALCDTQPCFNDAACNPTDGGFRCICAQSKIDMV